MAFYRYIAKTKDGRTIKEVADADSKEELVNRLRSEDFFIVSVEESGVERKRGFLDKLFSKGFHSFVKGTGKHSAIAPLDMCFLARHLSICLSAGVPLLRSLDIMAAQTESLKLTKILKDIGEHIRKGLSLSEAIEKFPQVFPSLWRGIIEIGEASGNLPFVLDKLANYLEMRFEFERKIKSALVYPAIVCAFAVIAITVFFKFILPRFTTIFEQFDLTLPLLTQIMFNISNIFNRYFLWIVVGMVGLVIGFNKFKRTESGKQTIDTIMLNAPLVSKLTLLSAVERFCSTAYILLESGVPIIYALDVIARSVDNHVIEKSILLMKDNVRKGKSLSAELAKIEVFPVLISEVARIGEEAGNMPEMFEKLSSHYRKDLSSRLDQLVSIFEPLLIFVLGSTIGVIVISLFMPIFKLVTLGGGSGY